MAGKETDIISHLLSVEQEAQALLQEAQAEADRRISAAKAQADDTFKKEYAVLVKEIDAEYDARRKETVRRCDEQLADYKARLAALPVDTAAFSALLASYLAAV